MCWTFLHVNTSHPQVTGIEVVWASVPNVLACKYITPTGTEVIWVSVQNVLACKYIAPMGIGVVSVSVKNVLTCKYVTPMGIKVVLKVTVFMLPTGNITF